MSVQANKIRRAVKIAARFSEQHERSLLMGAKVGEKTEAGEATGVTITFPQPVDGGPAWSVEFTNKWIEGGSDSQIAEALMTVVSRGVEQGALTVDG